jgi:hypothetical protein
MAGIPSPRTGIARLLRRPFAYDLPIAFFASAGVCAGTWNAWVQKQHSMAYLLGFAGVAVVALAAIKAAAQWFNAEELESLHPIEGALHVLHAALKQFDDNDSVRLRVTIHKPCGDDTLEQLTDYVGDDSPLTTRRHKFNRKCGIIGFAFHKQEPIFATRRESDYASYLRELITVWHYDETDARKLRPDTYSWMAIPLSIPGSNKVSAIVYCDASAANFFDNPKVQEIAATCCGGLSQFVEKHYPSRT